MNSGGCGIYASKPGVCSMYLFISYLEINKTSRDLLYMRSSNLLEIVLAFT